MLGLSCLHLVEETALFVCSSVEVWMLLLSLLCPRCLFSLVAPVPGLAELWSFAQVPSVLVRRPSWLCSILPCALSRPTSLKSIYRAPSFLLSVLPSLIYLPLASFWLPDGQRRLYSDA